MCVVPFRGKVKEKPHNHKVFQHYQRKTSKDIAQKQLLCIPLYQPALAPTRAIHSVHCGALLCVPLRHNTRCTVVCVLVTFGVLINNGIVRQTALNYARIVWHFIPCRVVPWHCAVTLCRESLCHIEPCYVVPSCHVPNGNFIAKTGHNLHCAKNFPS